MKIKKYLLPSGITRYRQYLPFFSLMLFANLNITCSTNNTAEWKPLLDDDLSQWNNYLSYRHTPDYDGSIPLNENGIPIPPIGKNKDSFDVFTVSTREDEPILRISGEVYGCLYTKDSFKNYHLKAKVKWGIQKWMPREELLRDSGILYHSIGPLGAEAWRTWMLSQEFQIMEGHLGDYWSQATSAIDVRAYRPEYIMNPVADREQPFIGLGHNEENKGFCLRSKNLEKPLGQWNTIELICYKDKSIHIVNNEIVMVLRNSRYYEGEIQKPLTAGKIQIQSEAAEVFYKDIQIRNLDRLPVQYQELY